MLSKAPWWSVILCGFLLSGTSSAAKPPDLPMPLGERFAVEIMPAPEEISVISPIPMQGNLLGMIASNMAVKRDEALAAPFRDRLLNYSFNSRMREALESTLPSEGISPAPWFIVADSPRESLPPEEMSRVPHDALIVVPAYSFDPWFRGLGVQIDAYVVKRYLKNKGTRLETQVKFHRRYCFSYSLAIKGKDERIAYWQSASRPALEKMLDTAIQQTVDMLAFDFSTEGRSLWGRSLRMMRFEVDGREYAGRLLRRGKHWVWALGATQYSSQGGIHYYNFGITGSWVLPDQAAWDAFLLQPAESLPEPDAL